MSLTFGEKIKEARKQKNLTQKQLADLIGAAHNSISDWENNKNKPDPDTIEVLCGALKITPNYLLASTEDDFSPKEKLLIKKYRFVSDYSPDGASVVDTVLDREYAIAEKLKEKEDAKDRTAPPPATAEIIPMRFLSYYQKMASAGRGEYLFPDIPTEVIPVPDTPLSRRADFVIGVNGRSMEDTYFDGDKVLVEKASEVPIGKIGIFIRENECFIKEARRDRLISHNADKEQYPDIYPDEREIDTIGIVLGKVGD